MEKGTAADLGKRSWERELSLPTDIKGTGRRTK